VFLDDLAACRPTGHPPSALATPRQHRPTRAADGRHHRVIFFSRASLVVRRPRRATPLPSRPRLLARPPTRASRVRRAPRRWPVNAARRPHCVRRDRIFIIVAGQEISASEIRPSEIRVRVALASAPLSASP
jgi:hypothetical protein